MPGGIECRAVLPHRAVRKKSSYIIIDKYWLGTTLHGYLFCVKMGLVSLKKRWRKVGLPHFSAYIREFFEKLELGLE